MGYGVVVTESGLAVWELNILSTFGCLEFSMICKLKNF